MDIIKYLKENNSGEEYIDDFGKKYLKYKTKYLQIK